MISFRHQFVMLGVYKCEKSIPDDTLISNLSFAAKRNTAIYLEPLVTRARNLANISRHIYRNVPLFDT